MITDIEFAIASFQKFGDPQWLSWVLRSGRPLSQSDRDLLADYIDGKIKLPRGGAPRKNWLNRWKTLAIKAAGYEVERIKAEWRKQGQRIRGRHDEALDLAVAKYCPPEIKPDIFEEKLRRFMRKPVRIRHAT